MGELHNCEGDTPADIYGPAIDSCYEHKDFPPGTLWVSNGEYASQVAYCPYCGYKAQVPPVVTPFKLPPPSHPAASL